MYGLVTAAALIAIAPKLFKVGNGGRMEVSRIVYAVSTCKRAEILDF